MLILVEARLAGVLTLALYVIGDGPVAPWWLSWLAMGSQLPAVWLIMAIRRGVPLPKWLFPLRGPWLHRLVWLVFLASAGYLLWEFSKPQFDLPRWSGMVIWLALEVVVLLFSAGVFAIAHKAVQDFSRVRKLPLGCADVDVEDGPVTRTSGPGEA